MAAQRSGNVHLPKIWRRRIRGRHGMCSQAHALVGLAPFAHPLCVCVQVCVSVRVRVCLFVSVCSKCVCVCAYTRARVRVCVCAIRFYVPPNCHLRKPIACTCTPSKHMMTRRSRTNTRRVCPQSRRVGMTACAGLRCTAPSTKLAFRLGSRCDIMHMRIFDLSDWAARDVAHAKPMVKKPFGRPKSDEGCIGTNR